MARKKIVYLPLFTRDWLGSPKLRACSAQAKGVYIDLLCYINDTEKRGSFALHEWELHPESKRSLTYRCRSTRDKYARLRYFAEYFSINFMSYKKSVILAGFQELYKRGVIIIEDDRLIQPRMYKDSGHKLQDDDYMDEEEGRELMPVGSPEKSVIGTDVPEENTIENNTKNKSAKNGTKKSTRKGTEKEEEIHACARLIENKNKNIYKDNKENNNNKDSVSQKTKKTSKQKEENSSISFDDFWKLYDKMVDRAGCIKLWEKLSEADKKAIMEYVPKYKESEPNKQFRKGPIRFLRNRSWEDEIIKKTVNSPRTTKKSSGEAQMHVSDENFDGQETW